MIYVSNPLIIEDFGGHIVISQKRSGKTKKEHQNITNSQQTMIFHSTAEATSLICLGHLRQEDSKAAERTAREALSMFQVGGWMDVNE